MLEMITMNKTSYPLPPEFIHSAFYSSYGRIKHKTEINQHPNKFRLAKDFLPVKKDDFLKNKETDEFNKEN